MIGKTQIYRMEWNNIMLNVHGDLTMYPFDVQNIEIELEFQSIEYEGVTIRFNLHDGKNIEKNLILSAVDNQELDRMDIFKL